MASSSGSALHRTKSIELLGKAHDVNKSIDTDDKLRNYIKQMQELNKQAAELDEQDIKDGKMPDISTLEKRSEAEFNDRLIHLPKLTTPIEEWTERQYIDNYRMELKVGQAEISLWRGITQMQNGSPLKGAYNLRKAWKGFQALLHEVETQANKHEKGSTDAILYHTDIHEMLLVGVGIFYYLISVLPSTVTKVLEFIGFKAERDIGIEYLEYAASRRGLRSITAILMLAINYLFIPSALEDKHQSLQQFKPHMEYTMLLYPQGGMLMMLANQYVRKIGDYEKGIHHLNEAIDSLKNYDFVPSTYIAELGHCYFALRQYDKAIEQCEKILNLKDSFEAQSVSALTLAVCYLKTGQKEKCDEIMKKLPSLCKQKNQLDLYVLDKIKFFDSTKNAEERRYMIELSVYELLYFKRDIAHLPKDKLEPIMEEFDTIYNTVMEKFNSADMFVAVHMLKGVMLKSYGNETAATELLDSAIARTKEVKYGKQNCVAAAYERGEQLYFAGNLKASEEYMKKAESFSKYGFEDVWKSRIKLALKKIHKELNNA